jgi:hypothetical protein
MFCVLSCHRKADNIAPLANALVGLQELLQPSDETMQRLKEFLQ